MVRFTLNLSKEFTFFGWVMIPDMALEGIICCLASLDFFVSWKTENALVCNVSVVPVRCLCHNKIITQIPPSVVFKVLVLELCHFDHSLDC